MVSPTLIATKLHSRQIQPTQLQPTPAKKPSQTFMGYISNELIVAQPSAIVVLDHFTNDMVLLDAVPNFT